MPSVSNTANCNLKELAQKRETMSPLKMLSLYVPIQAYISIEKTGFK